MNVELTVESATVVLQGCGELGCRKHLKERIIDDLGISFASVPGELNKIFQAAKY